MHTHQSVLLNGVLETVSVFAILAVWFGLVVGVLGIVRPHGYQAQGLTCSNI